MNPYPYTHKVRKSKALTVLLSMLFPGCRTFILRTYAKRACVHAFVYSEYRYDRICSPR